MLYLSYCNICYTYYRYQPPLHLWKIKSFLKLYKVPKYYSHGCLRIFYLLSIIVGTLGVWVFEILTEGKCSHFSYKSWEVRKIRGASEKGDVSVISRLIDPFQCLSFWVFGVRVCILCIYTISIGIVCVSREELKLSKSNQQIYGFCKWVFFKKQRHSRN